MGHSLWEGDRHAAVHAQRRWLDCCVPAAAGSSSLIAAQPHIPSKLYVQTRAQACGANETHLSAPPTRDQVLHAARVTSTRPGRALRAGGLARCRRHQHRRQAVTGQRPSSLHHPCPTIPSPAAAWAMCSRPRLRQPPRRCHPLKRRRILRSCSLPTSADRCGGSCQQPGRLGCWFALLHNLAGCCRHVNTSLQKTTAPSLPAGPACHLAAASCNQAVGRS